MLPLYFTILTASGIWCRPTWNSVHLIYGYRLYSFVVNVVIFMMVVAQVAHLIHEEQGFDEFNDTVTVTTTISYAWVKGTLFILTQHRVISLLGMFQSKFCIVQSSAEERIQKKYDDLCRAILMAFFVLVQMTVLCLILTNLIGGVKNREFMYPVMLPHELTKPQYYWFINIHQSVVTVYTANISITVDTLIVGFMLQVCSQLEILKYRIKNLPAIIDKVNENFKSESKLRTVERQLLRQHAQLHVHIFKLANGVCSTFYEILAAQFFVSAFAICFTVYQLSIVTSKAEIILFVLYLVCVLQELFLFCFFGNEVTLKSTSVGLTVFNMDWTAMSPRLVKDLSMIIVRTCKPIDMSCGPVIHLTLESFSKIVKLSYSVFNFLKQTQMA